MIDDLGLGGAQRQLVELLRGLASLGYEQQVVSLSRTKDDYAQTIRQMNIPLTLIPHVGMWSWETLGRLSELFHQMRPTVVHTWLFTADLYGRLAAHFSNVPIIISTVRSVEPDKPRHYVWADRVLKRWTHHFIANAEAVGEVLFQREGVAREKISVIRNGVDTQHFSPQPSDDILRTHLGALPEQPLIAIVGRLAPVKDHATFLHTAALVLRQLPNCRFTVIGNGPLKASLQQWVQRKDMEHAVKFAEGRSDMSPIYAACDVIVVSSRYEGC
ncbi:MAG: glycosyltransferase, partial [Candidatus Omnitrophica bacterium]|nr:glycosyltransferase [Candidatus Omnitrophota bacterium]